VVPAIPAFRVPPSSWLPPNTRRSRNRPSRIFIPPQREAVRATLRFLRRQAAKSAVKNAARSGRNSWVADSVALPEANGLGYNSPAHPGTGSGCAPPWRLPFRAARLRGGRSRARRGNDGVRGRHRRYGVTVVEYRIAEGRGQFGRDHPQRQRERAIFPVATEHRDHRAMGEGRRGNSDPIGQTVQLRGLRVIKAHHDSVGSFHGEP